MAHNRVEVLEGCLEKEKCVLRNAVAVNEVLQVRVFQVSAVGVSTVEGELINGLHVVLYIML